MNAPRILLSFVVAAAVTVSAGGFVLPASAQDGQGAKPVDRRKLTTIQTSTADIGKTKNAVEVMFLDLPFGETTFGYMENGGNEYYSTRKWPVAHLKLAKGAQIGGKSLGAGDYVVILTPKGAAPSMTLSFGSYKPAQPGGTFLVPGNVFTDVPENVSEVVSIPVTFTKGEPMVDHLVISLESAKGGTDMKIHYGNRWYTQHIGIK